MTPDERYAAVVGELVGAPGVAGPTGGPQRFGSTSVKVSGKMFAMLSHGRFVVKLPANRIGELVASGTGARWDAGKGRVQREWMAVEPGAEEQWLPLAQEAMAFVAGASKKRG
jgi:hypothetical protein